MSFAIVLNLRVRLRTFYDLIRPLRETLTNFRLFNRSVSNHSLLLKYASIFKGVIFRLRDSDCPSSILFSVDFKVACGCNLYSDSATFLRQNIRIVPDVLTTQDASLVGL